MSAVINNPCEECGKDVTGPEVIEGFIPLVCEECYDAAEVAS